MWPAQSLSGFYEAKIPGRSVLIPLAGSNLTSALPDLELACLTGCHDGKAMGASMLASLIRRDVVTQFVFRAIARP
jgi:hypothetical protein